jgi:acyl-CoA synthetase (AMP-forming)/AMP-acid ligase II
MRPDRATVPALVARWSSEQPDTCFLVTETQHLTFAELDDASARVAALLARHGVGKGTRVGLLLPNGLEWAVLACGILRAGAVLVPLSTLLRPVELEAQLRIAAVEALVLAPAFRGRDYVADLAAIAPGARVEVALTQPQRLPELPRLHTVVLATDLLAAAAHDPAPDLAFVAGLDASVRPADDMVVMFTAGSRGAPKGVIHTHGGALGAVAESLGPRCLGSGDRLYIPMPFFWMGGFGGGLLSALVAGASLVSEAEPEPARTLALLEREQVTLFRGWPEQAVALAAHPAFAATDLSALKPGSLDAVLAPEHRRPPGVRSNLFGMTESFGPYSADPLDTDLPPDKHGSCGRPFPSMTVRIVDVDTGAAVEPGTTGEIQLRGPNLMRGVCGRLRADVFTADGYYPTGDLGWLDADGYLFFVGRRDDMIKVKGATVYPSEVESALLTVPGVVRAHVVDLRFADGRIELAAVVVLTDDATLTDIDLAREAKARLSAFKVPSHWEVVERDEVPTTATGKVDKGALQALFAGRSALDGK